MIVQVKKHKDGQVELLEKGNSLAVMTREQAKALIDVLIAATREKAA